uniref:Uncharacterized protein n=1 Tax=viral metagenome TaxID=1070528 RepID=A0A6C0I4A0_9ZZZZ
MRYRGRQVIERNNTHRQRRRTLYEHIFGRPIRIIPINYDDIHLVIRLEDEDVNIGMPMVRFSSSGSHHDSMKIARAISRDDSPVLAQSIYVTEVEQEPTFFQRLFTTRRVYPNTRYTKRVGGGNKQKNADKKIFT